MSAQSQRLRLLAFQYVLAGVVFILSVQTVMRALHAGELGIHSILMACLAGLEALAAVLFVVPGTMKMAGYLLLGIFFFAFVYHGLHGEWNYPLLVYGAGVAFLLAERKP